MPYITQTLAYRDWYFGGPETFAQLRESRVDTLPSQQRGLIQTWVQLALANERIAYAFNPPFSELSITNCQTKEEFLDNVLAAKGESHLGEGFALGHLCFINKGAPEFGCEWLVLTGRLTHGRVVAHLPGETQEQSRQRLSNLVDSLLASEGAESRGGES